VTRCPLCRARLGSAAVCPRCGADLTQAQKAEAEAHRRLQQALAAWAAGDQPGAQAWTDEALWFHRTRLGEVMAGWLARAPAKLESLK
jgi:predicted amidophosphoribosyltransferase